MQSALAEAGIEWMSRSSADDVVARFRASGRPLMAIDGFMGSGKSPFGSMMEARVETRCLRVDGYLPAKPPQHETSLIKRLNVDSLYRDLEFDLRQGPALIEGVLMRVLTDSLPTVSAKDVFHVYVAGAWMPDEVRVTWPDANQLGSEQGVEPQRQIVEYHRAQRPHERFDVVVLRNQNEPARSGSFIAPDGQSFSIPEAVWERRRLHQLRVNRFAYTCSTADFSNEPIGLIRPPVLSAATRQLNDDRLKSVLNAIKSDQPLPPVVVVREQGDRLMTLLDGAHRYFASVATGLTRRPALRISPQDAEVSYGYVTKRHRDDN